MVLTSTIKSTSSVALLTFALEGSLGVETLCMEVAPVCICHTFIYIWGKIQTLQQKLLRPKAPDSLFVPPISFQVCKQLMLDQDSAVTIRGRRIHTRRQCLVSAPNAQMLVHAFTENSEHPSKDKLNAVIS